MIRKKDLKDIERLIKKYGFNEMIALLADYAEALSDGLQKDGSAFNRRLAKKLKQTQHELAIFHKRVNLDP